MANKDKTDKAPCNYPFTSKREIKARLDFDPEYRLQAMVTLLHLQTQDEQDTRTTKYTNKAGFMSSHAVNGTRIAQKIVAGEELTEDDLDKVARIAPAYSRQLARQARDAALRADPELAATAAVFGV